MKVSVIMPSYQGARYILETLQSIAEQTRVPDQVVVSVDHSTDGTAIWPALLPKPRVFP